MTDNAYRHWVPATRVTGGASAARTAGPFVWWMRLSGRGKAAGVQIEADVLEQKLAGVHAPAWRRMPIWMFSRLLAVLASAGKKGVMSGGALDMPYQPKQVRNEFCLRKSRLAMINGVFIR